MMTVSFLNLIYLLHYYLSNNLLNICILRYCTIFRLCTLKFLYKFKYYTIMKNVRTADISIKLKLDNFPTINTNVCGWSFLRHT